VGTPLVPQQAIIDIIVENGGSDPQNSRFIFHFNSFGNLFACRDRLDEYLCDSVRGRRNSEAAKPFYTSPLTMPSEEASRSSTTATIADAWIVCRTAGEDEEEFDVLRDKKFFLRA
jgi:hypothetical protein